VKWAGNIKEDKEITELGGGGAGGGGGGGDKVGEKVKFGDKSGDEEMLNGDWSRDS